MKSCLQLVCKWFLFNNAFKIGKCNDKNIIISSSVISIIIRSQHENVHLEQRVCSW